MTEPEQWAVELWNRAADAADGCATQSFGDDAKAAALTIQRAFEERVGQLVPAQPSVKPTERQSETLHKALIASFSEFVEPIALAQPSGSIGPRRDRSRDSPSPPPVV